MNINTQLDSPPRGAATFHVACGIIVAVGLAQAILAATGGRASTGDVAMSPVPHAPKVVIEKKEAPLFAKVDAEKIPPRPPLELLSMPPLVQPSDTDPLPPAGAPQDPLGQHPVPGTESSPASLDTPIKEEIILEHLDRGLAAREKGDMKTALDELRAAHAEMPDHPKLIFQLAETLDLMGLESKAKPYWDSLVSFGSAAGDYYVLATKRTAQLDKVSTAVKAEREGRFTFSDIEVIPATASPKGTNLTFRFSLKKNFDGPIGDLTNINLAFHLFDLVNGRGIDRSFIPQPEPKYLEEPVDWAEGSEKMELQYDLGVMSPEEIKRFGKRIFYGYSFEIYFKDKLQDIKALPKELSDFAHEMKVPADRSMPDLLPGANGLIPQPPPP